MFGLERAALYPVAGAWTVAAMLLTILHTVMKVGFLASFMVTAGPAAAVTVICLTLVQGKPPGYLRDWLEQHVLQTHEEDRPRRAKLQHPLAHAPHERT